MSTNFIKALALENAKWEAAYPRSGAHMQGARKNARNRYRAFFDDSGKVKPGTYEYIRSTPRAAVFGNPKWQFAIGPCYCSSQERDIEEVVVAYLRRRARPRTQAVYEEADEVVEWVRPKVVKWVRPTPAHSAYPMESETVAAHTEMWSILPILTPLAQAFRQVTSLYDDGDGSGASKRDETQLDLLKAVLALRSTCKTALLSKGDGRLMTRPLRRRAVRLHIRRWDRRMVHAEAFGVAIMEACTGILKKIDSLCNKFQIEEAIGRRADALMAAWMREVGHIDYSNGNACAFYEKDELFKTHVTDVMSKNRTGVNSRKAGESVFVWEWAMSPMARAIRKTLRDMRERLCTCIEQNGALLMEPRNRPSAYLYGTALGRSDTNKRGQYIVDGFLFVLEGYAAEFGNEVRKLLADWKNNITEARIERDYEEARLSKMIEHARRDDRNLSVFLKTSSSEWFIDQNANEGPLRLASETSVGGKVCVGIETPEKTESEELATEFLSLCDAKAGMYYNAHPDAHKSRWTGAYAEPERYGNLNNNGWDHRIEKFDRLLRARNNAMDEAFESFQQLQAIRAQTLFYGAHALELEEWIKGECQLLDCLREERCAPWAREYEPRRALIDVAPWPRQVA